MLTILAGILIWLTGPIEIGETEDVELLDQQPKPDTKPPRGELSAAGQGYEAAKRGEPLSANPYRFRQDIAGRIKAEQWRDSHRFRTSGKFRAAVSEECK